MLFIIQKDTPDNCLNIECALIKELIAAAHYTLHKYECLDISDLINKTDKDFPASYKQAIPIGTIEFTTLFLDVFYGITEIKPIEIPKCLRTYEFLKRDYKLVPYKNLPQLGRYFIKNASRLKQGTDITDIAYIHKEGLLNKEDVYQISEIVNPLSEYRIYVVNDKIYSMACYDGNPTIFPDIQLIQKAIMIYSLQKDCPHSYTMDVMITDKGTAIIEVHIMMSCGIYNTVVGSDFLYAYQDAMHYLIHFNTPIETTLKDE